jgi:isoleucyl-tRNA synthetase
MLARLDETIVEVTEAADKYELAQALRPLRTLIDDLSNWYVRRSRRRFWKSEDDGDKASAYVTLHYVLVRITQLLAPWSPFVADKMWRELTDGMDEPASVHLSDWPEATVTHDMSLLIAEMQAARLIVTDSLSLRADAGIKVRQPLQVLEVPVDFRPEINEIIAQEVNVRGIVRGENLRLDTIISPELKAEGLMRDVVRHVQTARKAAGLEVEDRIILTLMTQSADLADAIIVHDVVIKAETLAVEVKTTGAGEQVPVKVSGDELYIGIAKA